MAVFDIRNFDDLNDAYVGPAPAPAPAPPPAPPPEDGLELYQAALLFILALEATRRSVVQEWVRGGTDVYARLIHASKAVADVAVPDLHATGMPQVPPDAVAALLVKLGSPPAARGNPTAGLVAVIGLCAMALEDSVEGEGGVRLSAAARALRGPVTAWVTGLQPETIGVLATKGPGALLDTWRAVEAAMRAPAAAGVA